VSSTSEPSYLEDYDVYDVPAFAALDELDELARAKLLGEGFIICLNDPEPGDWSCQPPVLQVWE
jgi:hypothetical protein